MLKVKRRKYRFRFLDCSLARIYDFKLMTSTRGPKSARDLGYTGDELQGQYRIPDGQQCMQIHRRSPPTAGCCRSRSPGTPSSCGRPSGARCDRLPTSPGTKDGTPTKKGDVIYLTNIMKMPDGRMWTNSTAVLARPEVQGADAEVRHRRRRRHPDASDVDAGKTLRPLPVRSTGTPVRRCCDNRLIFEVQRGVAAVRPSG